MSRAKTAARFLCLPLLVATAVAQQSAAPDLTAQIDRIVHEQMHKQHIPAMTVAVAEDGKILYSKGFGTADVENDVAADSTTLIRTGSIAKPLTAVAAMTLVEAGKLDLDAPVQKYCPAFPVKRWPITTRELLMHTSGIRHYKDDEIDITKHYDSMSAGFAIFAADPLLFEPGTKFNYSTYGYTVLGCVIEGASGEPYYQYVREHVLLLAEMRHTFVDDHYAIVGHRARGYQIKNNKLENAGPMDSSYKVPGGGLVSTAEDYVRFGEALMEGKLVKPQTLTLMWTPSKLPELNDGKPSNYGMGFGVFTMDGQQVVGHSGGQQGTSTYMAFVPGKDFAVAVFANQENSEPFDVAGPILDLYHMPNPHPKKK